MTLGEMLEEITVIAPEASHGDLIRRLNIAQDRIARDMMFPQYYVEVTGVTDAFSLPAGARGEGLLEVRREEDGLVLPIKNTQEADALHPDWKDWDEGDTLFIVFDPKMVGGDGLVRPVPLPLDTDPQDYYITYIAKPDDMTSLTDQPWNGMIDSYHELLVNTVLFEVLFAAKDDRWQYFYQKVEAMKDEMFQMLRPRTLTATNLVWNSIGEGTGA